MARCSHGFLIGTGLCPVGCGGPPVPVRKSSRLAVQRNAPRIGESNKPDPRVDEIVIEVAVELGIDRAAIVEAQPGGGNQPSPGVRARAEVFKRSRDRWRLSQVEVARALNLHPTTIVYAMRAYP